VQPVRLAARNKISLMGLGQASASTQIFIAGFYGEGRLHCIPCIAKKLLSNAGESELGEADLAVGQAFFLGFGQALDVKLKAGGRCFSGSCRAGKDKLERGFALEVFGAFLALLAVLGKAPGWVEGDAGVEAVVVATN
jgi:hypothetical protein